MELKKTAIVINVTFLFDKNHALTYSESELSITLMIAVGWMNCNQGFSFIIDRPPILLSLLFHTLIAKMGYK